MCRILGIVAQDEAKFQFCLSDAPRSMVTLSREHPDGWGVAVYGDERGWTVGKQPLSAFADPRFVAVAGESQGRVLVAHIRRRTVGPVSIDNTHPFQSGPWVFAHNGTIEHVEALRAAASPDRLAAVVGSTDSEIFFAYLLTRLDAVGGGGPVASRRATPAQVDGAIVGAVAEMAARPGFGACNFLLSDGDTLYAFRLGRTLHVLERPARALAANGDGCGHGESVLVASEAITDEAWAPVDEGTLLKVSRHPSPHVTVLSTGHG